MADPKHVRILKQGAKDWNRWRAAGGKGLIPDLSDLDLTGKRLVDFNLNKGDATLLG